MSKAASDHPEGVAVVGMAGRFPGASDLDAFWTNLKDGVESITVWSAGELAAAGVPAAMLADPAYVRAKPVLSGIELFDAPLFGLSPLEASVMDPQHRLFLECAWEALESAGHDPERFPGRIGVYGGANMSSYLLYNLLSNLELVASLGAVQGRISTDKDFLTTQVSYRLNLRGPSLAVQTACSTSLVAIHLACQALLDGDCDMALAGGAGVNLPHVAGYLHQEGSIFSPDGHCRAFDAAAAGTLMGDGVGIVALRRLADALADGDRVRAVVLGSAVNNDGSAKVGYTAPSIDGQAAVIAEALAVAGVEPDTIGYVEAHGTGTRLGDPIEVAALTQAFRSRTERRGFCALGSVKTNIGHLDAAAGVAGLIKTVLALEHRLLPPSLNFERPSPEIDFASSPFFVNAVAREWPAGETPRRAGVSSFGVGGTNAHAVLEEAPDPAPCGPSRSRQVLPLSARTPAALAAASSRLAAFLAAGDPPDLADVAYTLQVGRRQLGHRRAVVCRSREEAVAVLAVPAPEEAAAAGERPVAFLFPGQGAQHPNMGLDLYREERVFREELDQAAELLAPHLGLDLRELLFPPAGGEEEAARLLEETRFTQPALFAVEHALARLFMSWGIRPRAMIGHSIGEYVAACLAGVFPLAEALALVAARGRLVQELPGGAMLAVPRPEHELEPLLAAIPGLSLAAVNGPELCVAAGPAAAVAELAERLSGEGVECSRVHTSHAFHSEMMAPVLGAFTERVARVALAPPRIPYLSNVTGTWITAAEATDPGSWARHLRRTVRLGDGLATLLADPDLLLLEVGPGQALTTLARQQPGAATRVVAPSLPRPRDAREEGAGGSARATALGALGRLWVAGAAVDWQAFSAGERRRRVPLPTYPFERERYWIEPGQWAPAAAPSSTATGDAPVAPLVRQPLERWFYLPVWKQADRLEPAGEPAAGAEDLWLVFTAAGDGLGERVVERLRAAGGAALAVAAGEAFAAPSDGVAFIRPGVREDYDALLREARALHGGDGGGGRPVRVLHLWSVGPGAPAGGVEPFDGLLFLAQALGESGAEARVGVVSSGLQAVTGEEAGLVPERALALGLCRVASQESPQLSFRSIDVVPPAPGSAAEAALAQRLVEEVAADAGEPAVAYRGRHRWVPTSEARPLDERFSRAAPLREGGVYLVTGGLDATARVFARGLVRSRRAKVALAVPPGVPGRERWADLGMTEGAEGGEATRARRLVEAVLELEAEGGEVMVVAADLATEEGARQAIAAVRERFGALHGVLHVEMVPGVGLLQLKTPAAVAQVFRPKVDATRALAGALAGAPLDFVALFSSTIAITGGLGQVDFCAANCFLDAFAHACRAAGGPPAVAIDWGAFRWEDWQASLPGGPAAINAEIERSLAAFGIGEEEALEALARVLASGVPQVVVSTGELDAVVAHNQAMTSALLAQPAVAMVGHARPALSTSYAPPRDEVEQGIAAVWQELLGIAEIGVDDNFFELAGNSLTAIQIVTRVRKAFDVELSMSSIFEAPTVAGLARVVRTGRLGEEALAEVDGILEEIEGLSPEEIERLLAQEMELEQGSAHGG